jgi:hypothetical protein
LDGRREERSGAFRIAIFAFGTPVRIRREIVTTKEPRERCLVTPKGSRSLDYGS